MPRSLYRAIVACCCFARSFLNRRWISLTSGATAWMRRIETIDRRMSGTSAVRTMSVVMMIAMPMSTPLSWWMPIIRIRNAWKIGLNSHASRLTGSALIGAGVTISGVGAAVAEGATVGAGVVPGASVAAGCPEPAGAGDWVIGSQA